VIKKKLLKEKRERLENKISRGEEGVKSKAENRKKVFTVKVEEVEIVKNKISNSSLGT